MAAYDTFRALRDFAKGKISKYELEGSDPSITEVKPDGSNLGQSKIELTFPGDDRILGMIGLSDDDIWFSKVVNSYYSDYEFMDWYSAKDDFLQGYSVYSELDEENIEKLRTISNFIYHKKFDIGEYDFKEGLSKKLYELFEKETENIISDYQSLKNSEILQALREKIDEDFNSFFEGLGFRFSPSRDEEIHTTVANLIMWYIRTNSIHLELSELLEKIFKENKGDSIGGWSENVYEYHNEEYFDDESFNTYVGRNLDSILEKIEDGADGEFDFQEYKEMVERTIRKFETDKWYKLPKKKDVDFKIDRYEMNPNKIVVKLRRALKNRELKLTEENFYHLLYQPTLFNLEEI
jgi:hypothetical protein